MGPIGPGQPCPFDTLRLDLSPKGVEEWFKKLSHAKENMTKFHFYFHDTVSGKDPSAIQIAQANITSLSPTSFGLVRMMDNPLTIGPNINSKVNIEICDHLIKKLKLFYLTFSS